MQNIGYFEETKDEIILEIGGRKIRIKKIPNMPKREFIKEIMKRFKLKKLIKKPKTKTSVTPHEKKSKPKESKSRSITSRPERLQKEQNPLHGIDKKTIDQIMGNREKEVKEKLKEKGLDRLDKERLDETKRQIRRAEKGRIINLNEKEMEDVLEASILDPDKQSPLEGLIDEYKSLNKKSDKFYTDYKSKGYESDDIKYFPTEITNQKRMNLLRDAIIKQSAKEDEDNESGSDNNTPPPSPPSEEDYNKIIRRYNRNRAPRSNTQSRSPSPESNPNIPSITSHKDFKHSIITPQTSQHEKNLEKDVETINEALKKKNTKEKESKPKQEYQAFKYTEGMPMPPIGDPNRHAYKAHKHLAERRAKEKENALIRKQLLEEHDIVSEGDALPTSDVMKRSKHRKSKEPIGELLGDIKHELKDVKSDLKDVKKEIPKPIKIAPKEQTETIDPPLTPKTKLKSVFEGIMDTSKRNVSALKETAKKRGYKPESASESDDGSEHDSEQDSDEDNKKKKHTGKGKSPPLSKAILKLVEVLEKPKRKPVNKKKKALEDFQKQRAMEMQQKNARLNQEQNPAYGKVGSGITSNFTTDSTTGNRSLNTGKVGSGQIGGFAKGVPLTNTEIDNKMDDFPDFKGTIARDEVKTKILPNIKKDSRFGYVMNTDPSNKPGQHWVSVFVDARPNGSNSIEYYNSLADPLPHDVKRDLVDIANKVAPEKQLTLKVNGVKDQSNTTDNCGLFASKFLLDRFSGKKFGDATGYHNHVINNVGKGESDIQKFKKTIWQKL